MIIKKHNSGTNRQVKCSLKLQMCSECQVCFAKIKIELEMCGCGKCPHYTVLMDWGKKLWR